MRYSICRPPIRYNKLGLGAGGTYEDINMEELQKFVDRNGVHPKKPSPWNWVLLLAIFVTFVGISLYIFG